MPIKVITGINDVATLHTHLVAEVDGWDPSTVHSGTQKKMTWKCKKCFHEWQCKVRSRKMLQQNQVVLNAQNMDSILVFQHGFI